MTIDIPPEAMQEEGSRGLIMNISPEAMQAFVRTLEMDELIQSIRWAKQNWPNWDRLSARKKIVQAVYQSVARLAREKGFKMKDIVEREKYVRTLTQRHRSRPPDSWKFVVTPEIENLIAVYEVHQS